MSNSITCPHCSNCFTVDAPAKKSRASAVKKAAAPVYNDPIPCSDREGWWIYTSPEGRVIKSTMFITGKEYKADANRRAKMALRHDTAGRNARLGYGIEQVTRMFMSQCTTHSDMWEAIPAGMYEAAAWENFERALPAKAEIKKPAYDYAARIADRFAGIAKKTPINIELYSHVTPIPFHAYN